MAKMNKKSMHMVFLLIIIVIASSLVMVYPSSRQGMTNMDNAAPLGWDMGQGMSGQSWSSRAEQFAASMGYTDTTKSFQENKGTPVPLAEGQLNFFADNQFKPECCVSSTYSSGTGCACLSSEQVNYLNQRGGNRTIAPTEF